MESETVEQPPAALSLLGATEAGQSSGNAQTGVEKGKETTELAPQGGEMMEVADETFEMVEEQKKESSDTSKEAFEEATNLNRRRGVLELEAGKKIWMVGKIKVPKYQFLRPGEVLEAKGSMINVTAGFPIEYGLVVRLAGLVWVRSGQVSVDGRTFVRRGKLVRNRCPLMVNSSEELKMKGRLVVQQDALITEDLGQIVQVKGQLKMRPRQFLYVKRYWSQALGRLNIKGGQVLFVEGEMWAEDIRGGYTHDCTYCPAKDSRRLDTAEEEEKDPDVLDADLKDISKVKLVASEKHRVVGDIYMPDNRVLEIPDGDILKPGTEIWVRGQLKTDERLVMTMTGNVEVMSGEVVLGCHKIVRHGRLLKNVKEQVVHGNQKFHVTGELEVLQNKSLTVGRCVVLEVHGQFKTMPSQTLCVQGYHSQIPGKMKIKPGQVLEVHGEVCVNLQRKEALSTQPAELHGQGKPQEAGGASTAHNAEGPASTSQQKHDDGAIASDDVEFNVEVEEAEGEDNDVDSHVKCPLYKITHISCAWDGAFSQLQKHVIEGHAGMLRGGPTFQCKALKDKVLLIVYRDEVFLYRKRIEKDRGLSIIVQPLGTADNKYEYEVTIRSHLERDISAVFSLRTKAEPNDDICPDAERWISIPRKTWKMFSRNNKLDMVVTIRENRTCSWMKQCAKSK